MNKANRKIDHKNKGRGPEQAHTADRPKLKRVPLKEDDPYVSIMQQAISELKSAPIGAGNDTLNKCALLLGGFVVAGKIGRLNAEAMLREAARQSGLGDDETERTIKSGLDAGIANPNREHQSSDDDAEIQRLAKLSILEYERERAAAAKKMNCRPPVLDRLVKSARDGESVHPRTLALPEPEPWEHPVDGAEVLHEIVAHIQRHVVMSKAAATAIALWIMFAHCIDAAQVAPRLFLHSPEMRCGKSTLLTTISLLTPRPLLSSNVSASVLFRAIEAEKPTFLIDEADTFLMKGDEIRGIVNSGHTRATAFVLRNVYVGGDYQPCRFSTWAPIAIAGIGKMPETIEDRSIKIEMRRRKPDEKFARLRLDRTEEFTDTLRRAKRWASDNMMMLASHDPDVPDSLNDRAQDNWRMLIAIADLAGADWGERARAAALELSTDRVEDEQSIRIVLLSDIRDLFQQTDDEALTSEMLVNHLVNLEDRPWSECGKPPKPISKAGLARLLKPFGIWPGDMWVNGTCLRGYRRSQFEDSFARYLPPGAK